MFSDFWNRIVQIALLLSPILMFALGIDIMPVIDGLGEIVTVYLPAILVIVKDIIHIIKGWGAAKGQKYSFSDYRKMKPAKVYQIRQLADAA